MDDIYIDLYIHSLETEQKKSVNTLEAYRRDIKEFYRYMRGNGARDASEITNADIVAFMMKLKDDGKSGSTINRKMASLRSYTAFLCREGVLDADPCDNIKAPKVAKKDVDHLTVEEVDALLSLPDDSPKGVRDRAILELLYGTGIRVTEAAELKKNDVNFRIGFITCSGEFGKARIIPLGKPCRSALENYLENVRRTMNGSKHKKNDGTNAENTAESGGPAAGDASLSEDEYVFVNMRGEKLTRQGLWKIVKTYADKAGMGHKLTPQILRNSFAVHMIQNGADLKSIQELMGYEDAAAVQIYLSVTKNRIKEVYDRTHPRA